MNGINRYIKVLKHTSYDPCECLLLYLVPLGILFYSKSSIIFQMNKYDKYMKIHTKYKWNILDFHAIVGRPLRETENISHEKSFNGEMVKQ